MLTCQKILRRVLVVGVGFHVGLVVLLTLVEARAGLVMEAAQRVVEVAVEAALTHPQR